MQNASLARGTMNSNVIITMDDVDLSSKQLSKSIDVLHHDSPAVVERPPPTHMPAFPCQKSINANWFHPTFPLIFQTETTRMKFDDYENISLHNLWYDLKRLLQIERGGNINNNNNFESTKSIDRYDEGAYSDRDGKSNRKTQKYFPFTLNPMEYNASKSFPCYVGDLNESDFGNIRFPVNSITDETRFPYFHQLSEPKDNVNIVNRLHVQYFHIKKLEEILKLFKKSTTSANDLKRRLNFPLNRAPTAVIETKFPCVVRAETEVIQNQRENFKTTEIIKLNEGRISTQRVTESMLRNINPIINLGYTENQEQTTDSPLKPRTQTPQFPLKLNAATFSFQYFPGLRENYEYANGDYRKTKSFHYLKITDFQDNLKSLRETNKTPKYFSMTVFPLENLRYSKKLRKFPCFAENLESFNYRSSEIKIQTLPSQLKQNKTKITRVPSKSSEIVIQKFPSQGKQSKPEITKYPLGFNSEKDIHQIVRCHEPKEHDINVKTLQNIQKQMELFKNSSNKKSVYSKLTSFPLKQILMSSKSTEFPCPGGNLDNVDNFKTPVKQSSANTCPLSQFPIKTNSNSSTFPVMSKVEAELRTPQQYLVTNKIFKTLQKFTKLMPSLTFREFPLKTRFLIQNHNKFPLQYHETEITNPKKSLEFPIKPKTETTKFPHKNITPEYMLQLSVTEVRLQFQFKKISYSLQAIIKDSAGINHDDQKSITKFPLKERLVKKFYRKFPQETSISKRHQEHAWTTVKHAISINFEENRGKISENSLNAKQTTNVNIFKTTARLPSPRPINHNNLQTQQWPKPNNVNEQYASQVQFAPQQVHVENPAEAMATATAVIASSSTSPQTTNDDLTILPARNTKNMSISSEVERYSENFEHSQPDAIINIRDEQPSLSSLSTVLFAYKKNVLVNHQTYDNDADDEDEQEEEEAEEEEQYECATLRASTPPMSTTTTTSVRNAERIRAANQQPQQVLYDDHDLGDLCNPQVAQIVECSDVRDLFTITVDNGGEIIGNSSSTVSFLAKNEISSTSTSFVPTQPVSPTQSLKPPLYPAALFINTPTSDYKCRTSLENCPYCCELLPKYSVLELCEFCGNACKRTGIDGSKTGVTPQNYQNDDSQIAAYALPETEIQNESAVLSEISETDWTDVGETKVIPEETNEIFLDIEQIDEMKFEMRSAKGDLPPSGGGGGTTTSTASANTRALGKYNDSSAIPTHTSYARSKPTATTNSVRNTSDRSYTPSSLNASGTASRRLSNDSSGSATSVSGRSTPTSRYANDGARSTTMRRLSGDSMGSTTKSISGRSTPTSRYAIDSSTAPVSNRISTSSRYGGNDPVTSHAPTGSISNRFSTSSQRYGNDPVTAHASQRYANDSVTPHAMQRYGNEPVTPHTMPSIANRNSTPSLASLRNATSTSLLSVDLPRYTPSTESSTDYPAAHVNRTLSLDTPALDILPERTRLRRQRRLRPQDSLEDEEDAVLRLNRLKARITASLSEVKSVLKQYSTDAEGENDNQMANTLALPMPSYSSKDRPEDNQEGPVNFRFVKKIRRRSFLNEDEEDSQNKGQDETDKSVSGKSEQLTKEVSPSKLPQETKQIPNKIENNIKVQQNEVNEPKNNLEINLEKKSVTSTRDTMPIIKIEDHEKMTGDLKNQENKIETIPETLETNTNNILTKLNQEINDVSKPNDIKKSEVKSNINNNISDIKVNNIKSIENTASKVSQKPENKLNLNKAQNIKTNLNRSPSKSPQKIGPKVNDKAEIKINDDLAKSKKQGTNEIVTQEVAKMEVNYKAGKEERIKEISPKPTATLAKKPEGQEKDLNIKEVSPKPNVSESNQRTVRADINVAKAEHLRKDTPESKEISPKPYAKSETKEISPKSSAADIKSERINEKEVSAKQLSPKQIISEPKSKEVPLTPPTQDIKTKPDIKEVPPKPDTLDTKKANTAVKVNHFDTNEVSPKSSPSPTNEAAQFSQHPLQKIDETLTKKPASPTETHNLGQQKSDKDAFNETPVKLRKKVINKTKEPAAWRRASLAAVEGSKIEPPVKLTTPAAIQRRPSDSEAIVKKKLITTKTTTSGAIAEVTPKPKIVKIKRCSNKKSLDDNKSLANDTRHLATTQSETIPTEAASNSNTNKMQIEAPLPPSEANKSFQGDKNKDVTMPNDEMPSSNDTIGRKPEPDRILPTQLVIDEAAAKSTSPSSLTRKTIETTSIDDTIDRATNNRTTTTKKFESTEFENAGAAMLANVKTPLVSSTTASEANSPKQTVVATEDLLDLLQQEAVIVKPSPTKTHNELKVDESRRQQQEVIHHKPQRSEKIATKEIAENRARPLELEASIEKLNEPLDNIIQQQQVVHKTDVVIVKSNDADDNVKALPTASLKEPSISIDTAAKAETTTAPAPANNSSLAAEHATSSTVTKSHQQQEHTAIISDEAATKTNSSPQISISRQEASAGDTASITAATTLSSTTLPSPINKESLAAVETTANMPELQLAPAPVQTAEIPHEPGEQLKNKAVLKKIIRQTSIEKAKKTEGEKAKKIAQQQTDITTTTDNTTTTPAAIEPPAQGKPEVDLTAEVPQKEDGAASASEEFSETTEISEESSSQSEAAAALTAKPKKVRKIKKKVIIKRQKRRLSIGDTFFNNTSSTDDPLPAEVETLEKPIAYVSDDEDDKHDDAEEVVEEKKPLKSCINKKEYNIGDEVLYAERFRRTQIRWKRGRVKEQITSISYLIDIDGTDVSSHINYLKKYTGRKVNFGGKEYLEIDYEQLAEEEERAERVQRRSYSIWNMVFKPSLVKRWLKPKSKIILQYPITGPFII